MGVLLTAEDVVDLIVAATGWDFTVSEFRQSGERVYNLVRALCAREGITRESDILPGRLMIDQLPEGPARGMVIDRDTLEMLKDTYYQLRGWDIPTGLPTPERLLSLGLGDLVPELWP
jgi:aldehyde:ferredoxin oxidoreductase